MKRAFFLVLLLVGMLGTPLLAAVSLAASPLAPAAWAASTADSDCDTFKQSNPDGSASTKCANGSGLTTKDCVKIALPVLNQGENCISNDPKNGGAIVVYLRMFLRLLSGAVGLVVITMIVLSGIQYVSSMGDPGRIKSAKDRLQNAIIALVMYLSMFAILTFLVPGGIL